MPSERVPCSGPRSTELLCNETNGQCQHRLMSCTEAECNYFQYGLIDNGSCDEYRNKASNYRDNTSHGQYPTSVTQHKCASCNIV